MSIKYKKLVVGVTGASGAIYAQRLLLHSKEIFNEIFLMMSRQAYQVIETEQGIRLDKEHFEISRWLGSSAPNIHLLDDNNYFTPPASGSFRHDGMIIVPCSMGTAGRIANGISNDLLTRSADVCLKEQRKLILIPREMPWNVMMLQNMTKLAQSGATILPASPAWYHKPENFNELADTVVSRALQLLGVDHNITPQWMQEEVNHGK